MSPGWHFSVLHMALRVERRMAFDLPVFKIERFCSVMPMAFASSLERTFVFARMTSRFI